MPEPTKITDLNVIYLDAEFNPVDEKDAVIVKIIQPDGQVIFALPDDESAEDE